jgi:multicomponent Na+:H+ antiporter subunit G
MGVIKDRWGKKMAEILGAALLWRAAFFVWSLLGVAQAPGYAYSNARRHQGRNLGSGFILMAEALVSGGLGTTLKVVAVIVFLLLTAPVAAHLLGRAAYHRGIRLYEKTWMDELGGPLTAGDPDEKKSHRHPKRDLK